MGYDDQKFGSRTKLSILRDYSKETRPSDPYFGKKKQKASWIAMGSQVIYAGGLLPEGAVATKIYNEGCLYKLQTGGLGDLDGSLIYCDKEYIGGNLNWAAATLVDSSEGLISFGNNIISPNFFYILNASDLYSLTIPEELLGFVPFQEEFQSTSVVQISDQEYRLCTLCLGGPFIMDEELEYSREDITNLAIRPALEEYFKWFPKHLITTHPISSTESIDVEFPSGAYGVLHWDVQQAGTSIATGGIANTLLRSFEDAYFGNTSAANITGSYYGNRAPHTNLSGTSNLLLSRAATQGMVNYSTRSYFDTYIAEDGKKHAKFYSTKGGVAEIYWGVETWDFADVEFARLPELRKLCNANVKMLFGNLRRQAKSGIPGAYDYSGWVTEATAEIKEVREDWMKIPKASGILRGSLG